MRLPLALALLILALGLAGCGGGDDEDAAAPDAATQTAEASPLGGEEAPGIGCREVEAPAPRAASMETIPATLLSTEQTYAIDVRTSCGDFTITLDQQASPQAAASFVALVERGFFDGTVFHRIVPGFVIQGGDPTATGTGGPGYTTEDMPAQDTTYSEGVVAMAKTAAEPPGTAGSQFFVVTAPEIALPPEYAVIGTVGDGMDVVRRIAVLGDPNTELPTQPVVVERMEVRVSD